MRKYIAALIVALAAVQCVHVNAHAQCVPTTASDVEVAADGDPALDAVLAAAARARFVANIGQSPQIQTCPDANNEPAYTVTLPSLRGRPAAELTYDASEPTGYTAQLIYRKSPTLLVIVGARITRKLAVDAAGTPKRLQLLDGAGKHLMSYRVPIGSALPVFL
jgi:hypothetical protein